MNRHTTYMLLKTIISTAFMLFAGCVNSARNVLTTKTYYTNWAAITDYSVCGL